MASGAVLWFGEVMSAVPLRNNKAAAGAARSVTVLGATGSIGDSTMDLLRGARDRYRVEALTDQATGKRCQQRSHHKQQLELPIQVPPPRSVLPILALSESATPTRIVAAAMHNPPYPAQP